MRLYRPAAGQAYDTRVLGAEEMVQSSRALAALPEDLDSVPSIHRTATACNSIYRGSEASYGLGRHPDTFRAHTYMQAKYLQS